MPLEASTPGGGRGRSLPPPPPPPAVGGPVRIEFLVVFLLTALLISVMRSLVTHHYSKGTLIGSGHSMLTMVCQQKQEAGNNNALLLFACVSLYIVIIYFTCVTCPYSVHFLKITTCINTHSPLAWRCLWISALSS